MYTMYNTIMDRPKLAKEYHTHKNTDIREIPTHVKNMRITRNPCSIWQRGLEGKGTGGVERLMKIRIKRIVVFLLKNYVYIRQPQNQHET